MSKPKLVYPGKPFKDDRNIAGFQKPRGVFGEFPGATPKYARNNGPRQDFRDTMARMFIAMTPAETQHFLNSFSYDDTTRALASVLAVSSEDGKSAVGAGGGGYIDFLLQSAQHSFSEKMAVHEVMSDNYVAYFFGQAAPTFSYSGVLLNTVQDDQAANMFRIYRDIIRGSQLAKRRKLLTLRYDDMYVSGAAFNFTSALNSNDESYLQFSFSVLVKSVRLTPNTDASITVVDEAAIAEDDLAAFRTGVFTAPTGGVRKTVGIADPSAPTGPTEPVPPPAPPPVTVFASPTELAALGGAVPGVTSGTELVAGGMLTNAAAAQIAANLRAAEANKRNIAAATERFKIALSNAGAGAPASSTRTATEG